MYKKAVYPYENNFLFYRRNKVFAFEEYTNSTQEASFSGTKSGALAVLQTMDLDTSSRQLNNQEDRKAVNYIGSSLKELNTFTVWSAIPNITSKLTSFGAGLVETEYNRRHDYDSKPWGENHFRVAYIGECEAWDHVSNAPFTSNFVPNFSRVRSIHCCVEGHFHCSCEQFARMGIPCRHLFHVVGKYWPSAVMTEIDVHPHWLSSYKAYAYMLDKNGHKLPPSAAIEKYSKLTFLGPKVPSPQPEVSQEDGQSDPHFHILPAKERCTNWPQQLIAELSDKGSCKSVVASISQEIFKFTQEDSEESSDEHQDTSGTKLSSFFDDNFKDDEVNLQKYKEDQGEVYATLMPLFKELCISVEKDKRTHLSKTATLMRDMIAKMNKVKEGDERNNTLVMGMVLPLAKRKR
jgi:hypothetical protein